MISPVVVGVLEHDAAALTLGTGSVATRGTKAHAGKAH
jgi:hypothetical protein